MSVAMSLTAGTLSGHTHTLRSITSPWEISVMFNPQPSTSGAAVCSRRPWLRRNTPAPAARK